MYIIHIDCAVQTDPVPDPPSTWMYDVYNIWTDPVPDPPSTWMYDVYNLNVLYKQNIQTFLKYLFINKLRYSEHQNTPK